LNVGFPKSFDYSWGFPLVEGQTFSAHSFEKIFVARPITIKVLVKDAEKMPITKWRQKAQPFP
jgi:hypothetical protein